MVTVRPLVFRIQIDGFGKIHRFAPYREKRYTLRVEFEWDPNELLMKAETSDLNDDLRPEYDLAVLLKGGVRGKYAEAFARGTNLVLLAPDVARAFPSDEVVNEALRLVMRLAELPVARP